VLERVANFLKPQGDIPVRLVLWDGTPCDLGRQPRVTVRLKSPQGLVCFLDPTLANLAEAYVNGLFDMDGLLPDVVEAAGLLATANERAKRGLAQSALTSLARAMAPSRHDVAGDKKAVSYHYDVSNAFYGQCWTSAWCIPAPTSRRARRLWRQHSWPSSTTC
jgi:cyclopropane-fatty-acyl-phospholipid synthase